jgi:D-sedoheptulose 7-phosphate isomerase
MSKVKVITLLSESIRVKAEMMAQCSGDIETIASVIVEAFRNGNHLYLIGNGGSASDAQHIAGELVGRFEKDRKPLPAHALTADTSVLTAISNDFGYDMCFERQVEAFVTEGDVIIGLSTSGNSRNVINALELAKHRGACTICFTGCDGGDVQDNILVDLLLQVPSNNTARIQECHITVGHVLCSIIEEEFLEVKI